MVSNEYIIALKESIVEENINQEFRLKNIDETKYYFIEEINQNELMSKKYKGLYDFKLY